MTFPDHNTLKSYSPAELEQTCGEIRRFLWENVPKTGGHLASNLGVVEISVALLRVFDPTVDRLIYDTGHQSYVHKLLTGRQDRFSTLRRQGGLSGFPSRQESPADPFGTGHSTTGISAALGFAKAKRLLGEEGFAVCVIGDGSFTGGMAFEALNNISPSDRVIIILNDNQMSISRSVGSLKGVFSRMRTRSYYRFKGAVRKSVLRIPMIGGALASSAKRLKDLLKRGFVPQGNFFEQYGLNYFGPADGNDVETVEFLLREATKKDRPSLIHLCTKKGKGYGPAEENPSAYHGLSPANASASSGKSFSRLLGETLTAMAEEDERIVALTAAMTDGVGLRDFAGRFPKRFFDVGIAEEHAVCFAAALAAAGMKPCFAVYSTFFQRALDPFLHDAALQHLPVVIALDRAGLVGEDGATHHGLFDLNLCLPIPDVAIFAPVAEKEMKRFLSIAFHRSAPSVIRYPKGSPSQKVLDAFPCEEEVERFSAGWEEPRLRIVTFGRTTDACLEAAKALTEEGIPTELIRFSVLKGFDPQYFSLFDRPLPTLFVEEGMKIGGFSQYLKEQLCSRGMAPLRDAILAAEERFFPHGDTRSLLQLGSWDVHSIVKEGTLLAQTGSISP